MLIMSKALVKSLPAGNLMELLSIYENGVSQDLCVWVISQHHTSFGSSPLASI